MQGRILGGKYRLAALLGRGGMGSVWRAEHVELGTPVAVKLIDPQYAESEEALERFRREARAAALLRSTNVVQVFDYGVDDDTPYIAMELLVGVSLCAELTRRTRLEPAETAAVLGAVASAMARAHDLGIIHRDLKPENIFLVDERDKTVVKVLDFGIAKMVALGSGPSLAMTRTGAMMGTPYYMSPEQAGGRRDVDHRSDIWSFGVIAYECLTGARPFAEETLGGMILAICSHPIPTPSRIADVPAGFDAWFARATNRDLNQRYQSILDADSALQQVCSMAPTAQVGVRQAQPASQAVNGALSLSLGQPRTVTPSTVTIAAPAGANRPRQRRRLLLTSVALAAIGAFGSVVLAFGGKTNKILPAVSRPTSETNAAANPSSAPFAPPNLSLSSDAGAAAGPAKAIADSGHEVQGLGTGSQLAAFPSPPAQSSSHPIVTGGGSRATHGSVVPAGSSAVAPPATADPKPAASNFANPAPTTHTNKRSIEKQLGF